MLGGASVAWMGSEPKGGGCEAEDIRFTDRLGDRAA
jgi:hypothetical protein